MKIYTRKGDAGETGLLGGGRVRKSHPRVEAYGTVDELNAVLGMARAANLPGDLDAIAGRLQDMLFRLGADLATAGEGAERGAGSAGLGAGAAAELEGVIDRLETELPPLRNFILPGGGPAGALLHLARTVCRRAERLLVALPEGEKVPAHAVPFLNRLSDLLFVMARAANQRDGRKEQPWAPK